MPKNAIATTCTVCSMKMRTTRRDGVATCRPCRQAARPPVPADAKLCTIDGCAKKHCARGYCNFHWQRWKRYGDATAVPTPLPHKVIYTEDALRVCKACEEPKPEAEYHKDTGGSDGYRAQCKDCRGKYMQGYYEDNVEQRREYMNERRKTLGDHVRALDSARYERDKDKRIALAVEQTHIRRARLQEVEHERGITVIALKKIHGTACCYCGVEMDFKSRPTGSISPARATLEHVLPISRGGGHTWENTALACHACNTSKNKKTVDEWELWKLELAA